MSNLIKNFEKNGYVIVPGDMGILKKIRNYIHEIIKKEKNNET